MFYIFMRDDGTDPAPVVLKNLLKSAGALSTVGTCTRPEERKKEQMEWRRKRKRSMNLIPHTIKELTCFE